MQAIRAEDADLLELLLQMELNAKETDKEREAQAGCIQVSRNDSNGNMPLHLAVRTVALAPSCCQWLLFKHDL